MSSRITVGLPGRSKINVTTITKNKVMINNRGGALGGAGGVDTFRELNDVDATLASQNDTVVYDESRGKFVVKELPIVNGGEF